MYIKEKRVKTIKIILVIVAVATVLDFAVAINYMGGMLVSYGLDFETITRAAGYDSSIRSFILAPFVLYV